MSGALFENTIDYLAGYDLVGASDYELRVLLCQHGRRAGYDANSEAVVTAVRMETARRDAEHGEEPDEAFEDAFGDGRGGADFA